MALAILCSGGDAPGMNPAIKKFVDYTFKKNEEPYLIYDGLEGLIDGSIHLATNEKVAGILHRGGTILRSSRSKRFYEYKYREQAYNNLKKYGITGLIILGGDGSFRALHRFSSEFDINFIGIPTTIDNDIYGTEYCLGVDTALNVIAESLDKIRDTASSFKRAFLVELMGRDCGYLTIASAMVSGAEICVVPEVAFDKEGTKKRLTKEINDGRNYVLAVISEGSKKTAEIHDWIQSELGLETRVTILGHIQRGGSPSVFDRMMAFDFTIQAVDYLLNHKNTNKVIVFNNGQFSFLDIETVVNGKYEISKHLLDTINYLD